MNIYEIISSKFDELSLSQKKVAHYILENTEEAAFFTANKIAQNCKVSETTVHRLAQALDFESFTHLKKIIYKSFIQDNRALNNYVKYSSNQDNDWLHRHFVKEAKNIMNTYKETNKEDINKAAKKMIEAEYIWIGGWRMTMAVTSYMQFVLKYILGNSSMIPQGEIAEYAGHFKKNQLLFVCAFPRYDNKVIKIAQHAKKVGSHVVALTDSTLSPICKYADIVLYAKNSSIFFLDSYTAAIAVCNTIINEISFIGGDRVKTNIEKMEECLVEFNE